MSCSLTLVPLSTIFFIVTLPCDTQKLEEYNIFRAPSPIWIINTPYMISLPYPRTYLTLPGSTCKCYRLPNVYDVCKQCLPKNFVVQSPRFKFKESQLEVFKRGFLAGYESVDYLDLNQHWQLVRVERGALFNMKYLKNLSLSFNYKLKSLDEGAFDGLENLEKLYMLDNGFEKLLDITPAMSPRYLPSLDRVCLNKNVFRNVGRDDFLPMRGTTLQQLNLVLCQIEHIHPEALLPLRRLFWLKIGTNRFSADNLAEVLESSNHAGLYIKGLNLYGMGLRSSGFSRLLQAIKDAGVQFLSLARNTFHSIGEDIVFPEMPQLEVLDLRDVDALVVTTMAFSKLPALKVLLVGANFFTDVSQGVLLPQLTHLEISRNWMEAKVHPALLLEDFSFSRMSQMQVLNLAGNVFVNELREMTFDGLKSLEMLSLEGVTASIDRSNTFRALSNLLWLNLNDNAHLFNDIYDYTMTNFFNGLVNLQMLLLANCKISFLPFGSDLFAPLVKLSYLDLSKNELQSFESIPKLPLTSLMTLDITQNEWTAWPQPFLPSNNLALKTLILRNNKLTSITSAMASDFQKLETVDLDGNRFYCNCNFIEPHIIGLNISSAFCASGDIQMVSEYVDYLHNHPGECEKPKTNGTSSFIAMMVMVSIIGTTSLIILTGIISYSYRWQIRYWVFLAKVAIARRNRRGRSAPRSQTILYDAFVSHSNEDAVFVGRLVQRLESEEPRLKLCVYERDFRIGSVITEAILASVYTSRRTLLVISDAFARSQWCRWETQLAEHHRLFTDDHGDVLDDRLVLVVFRPINKALLTPMLKYLLKTRRYIDWDDGKEDDCWKQLKDALGPRQK